MAITHQEALLSPETNRANGKDDTGRILWNVRGDGGETEAQIRAYVAANAPVFFEGLTRKNFTTRPTEAGGWWRADVRYSSPSDEKNKEQKDPGQGYRWSVASAGGATVNRLYSDELVAEDVATGFEDWALIGSSGNTKFIMGWEETAEGNIKANGLPIDVGGVQIRVEFALSSTQVAGGALLNVVSWAAQKAVNSVQWDIFPAKTLRVLEVSYAERNTENNAPWDVSFLFDYSPKRTITMQELSVEKEGQHVLDVMTQYKKVDASDLALPDIIRLAVHRVRPEINYATQLYLAPAVP